ncbi:MULTISPECIES: DoxX family membrane protein [Bacillaceae]|uniref:DoxX family membrane protein n=1 Tax=Evansella alkalicola TaxID=745819 RepID=A0ABS6JT04_9BACI|nr:MULTISPECIES: DoxX family membrane protein [Bacillaceae]MBU9721555.1 DoxX family membrane protein [Bacillus alkalicola]
MTKLLTLVSRLILGIIFLGAGINGFFVIFGIDPFIETSDAAMEIFQFDYLLVFEKSLEVICGILLLSNRFVPLALAILAPIIANILLLHIFMDPSLLLLAIVLVICHSTLLVIYRKNFLALLEKKPIIKIPDIPSS